MLTGFVFTRDYTESITAVKDIQHMHKNNARCRHSTVNDPVLFSAIQIKVAVIHFRFSSEVLSNNGKILQDREVCL